MENIQAGGKRRRYRKSKSPSRKIKQIKREVQKIQRRLKSLRRSPSRIILIRTPMSAKRMSPKIYVPPAEYRYSARSRNFWRPKIGAMRSNEYEFDNRYYAAQNPIN